MKSLIKIIAITLLSVGSLEAKGPSSSGSSRSYSSSSSRSYTPSRPSTPASKPYVAPSKPTAEPPKPASYTSNSTPSKPNTSVAQTSTRPTSNVEAARYKEAVKSGKTFQTREAAVNDFKATKASTYTSRYTSEPPTRPQYIPNSYRSNDGHTYNITYNQSGGGYGYWGGGGPGLGTFMLYDLASDAIMMNTMMDRDHYYVGNAPTPVTSSTYVERGSGSTMLTAFIILLVVVCVVFGISRSL